MATSEAPCGLGRIGQIAVTVRDLDPAVAFYRDRLGLKFLFQAPNVAFFDCNGVRLMLGLSEQSDVRLSGTVIYHKVADIQQAFATLKGRGVPVEAEPHLIVKMPDHDLWMAFLRDLDGNVFGLMSEIRPA